MNTVLVIGAGGVSNVTVHKMASVSSIFNKIVLASRTISKCKGIQVRLFQRLLTLKALKE